MRALAAIGMCSVLAGCGLSLDQFGPAPTLDGSAPEPEFAGPANLPPEGYTSEFWIDRRGCTFLATGTGGWVPQLNLDRTPKCDPGLAWEPEDPGPQPSSVATPSETVDPVTGVRTIVMGPQTIPTSYVQVGHFSDRDRGLAARQAFLDMGFPVVGGDGPAPDGPGVSLVLGPFTEAGLLGDGLDTAKRMGFEDAFTFEN